MSTDPNDLLFGKRGGTAKFPTLGTVVKGVVTDFTAAQMTNIKTNQPEFWDDGNPKMQLVITLDTDERDPTIEGDEGSRRVFAPVSRKEGSMCDAIGQAVRAAGAEKILKGGTLAIQWYGTEPSSTPGFSDRHLYVAQYLAPDPGAAANDLLGAGAPAAQPQPAQVAPVAQPEPAVAINQAPPAAAPVAAQPAPASLI